MASRPGKLLLDALDNHWSRYRKRLKACRNDNGEDAIHELRIATRRLLSLIELLRALAPPQRRLGKIRRMLKTQLDGFDDLRDTQVMLLEIAETLPDFPELLPFMNFLRQRETHLLQQISPHIASQNRTELRRKVRKAGRRFKDQANRIDIEAAIYDAIDGVYATVLARYREVDTADLSSIHHLRIPVKKLRYMLSAVQHLIPALPENQLQRLQVYLTRMGDIQNSAVLLVALDAFFLDGVPQNVADHYHKQQLNLIDQFTAGSGEIFDYWRPAPDEALPWQPHPYIGDERPDKA